MTPEMLWERTDPGSALQDRFGHTSVEAAAAWASRLLIEHYDRRIAITHRVVISAQNLMFFVTTESGEPLLIKVCRRAAAHTRLSACGAMVGWLADRGHPVARPLLTGAGDHQLLCGDRTVGVQPILPGALLDAGDHDQVRGAGTALAALHIDLAGWPDADLLRQARPIDDNRKLWSLPADPQIPADLRARLSERAAGLPALPRQPVHSDFRGANVLYGTDTDGTGGRNGAVTGILDFEEARLEAAVVDVAHALCLLGTWYRDWQPITPAAQRLFLDSYTDCRPLSPAEEQWLGPLVGWTMLGLGWFDQARRWLD